MSLHRVYSAISAITSAFASRGLPKERINLDDGYAYRAIDEVVERLAPLLGEHKLCILPRVLERTQGERIDPTGESLIHVTLRVAFDLVSVEDGSSHTIEAVGEALDHSDKASAKAMTSAYKHAVLHAFCIPVSGREDADRCSPGRNSSAALPAPVEGWAQWAEDIAAVVTSCATPEAIERLLASNRGLLSGLAREQPHEYARIGRAIAVRRKVLAQPVGAAASEATTVAAPPPCTGQPARFSCSHAPTPRRQASHCSQARHFGHGPSGCGGQRTAGQARLDPKAGCRQKVGRHGRQRRSCGRGGSARAWLASTCPRGSCVSGLLLPHAAVPRIAPGSAGIAVRCPSASRGQSNARTSARAPMAAAHSSRPIAGPSACAATTTLSSTASARPRSNAATHSISLGWQRCLPGARRIGERLRSRSLPYLIGEAGDEPGRRALPFRRRPPARR